MQRRTLLAGLAAGLAVAVPASTAATAGAAQIGISDQGASTFASPLFPQLKSKYARYVLPYDFRTDATQLQKWNAWYAGAGTAKQRILVSFEHSRKSATAARKLPSVASYTKEIKAFKKAYPNAKDISVWNEVNRKSRSGGEGQPTAGVKNAKRSAQYFDAARKVFTGSKYKIVALDVLDEDNPGGAIAYIKAFKKAAKGTPKYWGLHNYSDTNRFSQTRTKRIIKAFGSKGEVWATETGGIVQLGSATSGSFPRDVNRANKALGCMFTIAKSNTRIKRLYVYNFLGAPEIQAFDAGLVEVDGVTPRPGFATVVARKAGPCRK